VASHRRTSQPGLAARTSRVTALSAAAAAAAVAAPAAPSAVAQPADQPADVATRVDRLYEQAERATEQYNAAQDRSKRLRREVGTLQDEAARGQGRVNAMRAGLGTLAGAQYRSGGVDPMLALMLSAEPDDYLDKAAALDRIGTRESAQLRELQDAQRGLDQMRSEAADRLAELDRARIALNSRKRTVQSKLAAAQRLVNSLNAAQRAGLAAHLQERASRSGRTMDLHLPDFGPASGRAAMAVAAARSAVGAPYVWGSTGPSGFDCSGLMVFSYRHAGIALPRTSQAQMHAGQRVPLNQVRPGDLIIYRGDASHVGMYVGGGQVVHAPYPGARVRYDPVGMMPISAVTRP
jgi:cell wall-associated NlpC family hydrolase